MFRSKYVGVDIGNGYIVLIYQGKLYEVITPENTMESGEILNVEILSETIASLVSDNKLKGKKAVISYNGPSIFTKIIRLPIMTDLEIDKYLKLEVENIIPFPVEEGSLDYIETFKDEKNMEILIIALRNNLVLPYIKAVKGSGLLPFAIDIPALAFARVVFKEKIEGLQMIVDIGKASTDIHIYIDSVFRFSRTIKIGRDNINNGVIMDLQKELSRSIDYFRYSYGNQNTSKFTQAYLVGGVNTVDRLKEILKEAIGVEPRVLEDSKGILAKGLELWRDKA